MLAPLQAGSETSGNPCTAAVAEGGPSALIPPRQPGQEDIESPSELYTVGTLAKIAQVVQLPDGTVRAIVQGQTRLRLINFVANEPYLRAMAEELSDATGGDLRVPAPPRTGQPPTSHPP